MNAHLREQLRWPRRDEANRPAAERYARLALIVFAAGLVVALPLLLWFGNHLWFFRDDWDFLTGRNLRDLRDLFRPHNEHWSTLPIIAYRGMWRLAGLRSYVPYQALAVLLHLSAAVLLRVVMRRAGVGPWIATAAALLFVLLGSGAENITSAYRIGFVGSLVFGLLHLILTDHDGPEDLRDWLGLSAGLMGMMCSGVAVVMVPVVGLAVLVRRGLRAAAIHTVPLGTLYVVWWIAIAYDDYFEESVGGSPGGVVDFVRTGIAAAFDAMGQLPGVGVALGVLLVAGWLLAARDLGLDRLSRRAAVPGALLVGAFLFLVVVAVGRVTAFGEDFARSSRYIHLVVAMALPAVAFGAEAIVRRWRLALPVMLVLLVAGIPGNVDEFGDIRSDEEAFHDGYRRLILTIPSSDIAATVRRTARPETLLAPDLTLGFLLEGVASGRIPRASSVTELEKANATLRLGIAQSDEEINRPRCRVLDKPVIRALPAGHKVIIEGGAVRISYRPEGAQRSRPLTYDPERGSTLEALAPLRFRLEAADPSDPPTICG